MQKKKNFLVYCGNPGIGKTFLCAALMPWAMSEFNHFRYWTEVNLLGSVRASIDDYHGSDYLKTLENMLDDDLIFLDDVGSTGLNEWRKEVFFAAIDQRYNSMKPTIITSNLNKKEFKEYFPERVSSRLFDKDNIVIEILDGVDLRG